MDEDNRLILISALVCTFSGFMYLLIRPMMTKDFSNLLEATDLIILAGIGLNVIGTLCLKTANTFSNLKELFEKGSD